MIFQLVVVGEALIAILTFEDLSRLDFIFPLLDFFLMDSVTMDVPCIGSAE